MNYVVIKTAGKQYKTSKGETLDIELPVAESGKEVVFDKVLLYVNDDGTKVGTPYVDGTTVKAKVVENLKSGKVRVSKFKAKARYRRVSGSKQHFARVIIESIESSK